ncbi:ABC transporter substrate-binding protein [Aurantibacter sp.]|uniref:type IX secretion system anionic LPS delivery protein PorZ n=1 Tax=Aurantibacter sp. TaxID=2807103 RepID=UPI0035C858A6
MVLLKKILAFFILISSTYITAQNFEDSWKGHFSYLDIKTFSQSETKLYVSAENAIFSYDKLSNEITTISTIQGLSGDNITAIEYVESKNKLYVGFDTGLIQIYDEINNSTFSVVDILDKPTILPNRKAINDFNFVSDRLYISADFGVSVFFVDEEEFGDTYFIGPGNSQITVNQTTIFGDYIYAATEQNYRRGLLSNSNLIDSNEWETGSLAGNWVNIVSTETDLFAVNDRRVYRVNGLNTNSVLTLPETILDLTSYQNRLAVTTFRRVRSYAENLSVIEQFTAASYNGTRFTKAILSDNDKLFVGTEKHPTNGKPGFGVVLYDLIDTDNVTEIHPESPFLNRFFQIEAKAGHVWGTHGGHSITYGFSGGIRRTGLSHLIDEEWRNIPYDSLRQTFTNPRPDFLGYVSVNPTNPNNAMISSFWYGVVEVEGNQVVEKYNNQNSTLDPLYGSVHYTLASKYDSDGTYWVLNGRVSESLNSFQNNQWSSVNLDEIINPPNSNLGFGELSFDGNGNIFMATHGYGLISYKEVNGEKIFNNISGIENNMPDNSIKTVKVDQNNQVWFGTGKGLRVVYNSEEFASGNAIVEEIIISENGEASELLFLQYVTDIEVDGANNKWIGTLDNGLFYFSSDGQQTIYHFTKDNSPLPDNDILDISIDEFSGRVYIATEKGLVSFGSQTSKPQETLEEAYVYPNPVRPGFNIVDDKVKIVGLTDNMNIKITDIEGNLVTEAETKRNGKFKNFNLEVDGGTALWNGKNLAGKIVASGVYVVLLNDLTTFETKVLKIMLIR